MARKRKAVPLAPPIGGQSRKKARKTTTLFHKYTRERDAAIQSGKDVTQIDAQIEQMGGRREYQRASQISTSFHSTTKWILGYLARNGWLHGIVVADDSKQDEAKKRRRPDRRPTRVLEVGAINTELLDAACDRLEVRAIDLHSMYQGKIEEADFLQMPVQTNEQDRYDVIACSMVLNCVTTAAARGEMLCRLHHFLRPGGLVFLTMPKTCLNLSPYIDRTRFEEMMAAVGLDVKDQTKDSPKIAYFVGEKPQLSDNSKDEVDPKWAKIKKIRRGKKFRNDFAVTLSQESVTGSNLTYC